MMNKLVTCHRVLLALIEWSVTKQINGVIGCVITPSGELINTGGYHIIDAISSS